MASRIPMAYSWFLDSKNYAFEFVHQNFTTTWHKTLEVICTVRLIAKINMILDWGVSLFKIRTRLRTPFRKINVCLLLLLLSKTKTVLIKQQWLSFGTKMTPGIAIYFGYICMIRWTNHMKYLRSNIFWNLCEGIRKSITIGNFKSMCGNNFEY